MNVPARVASGDRLYRDVVHYYGPVGPWIEAAALRIFGRRLEVLEALGLLAAVLLFVSLWRLTARAGNAVAATLAATWAAALCLGAPNGGSFLFPYAFDALFAIAGGFFGLMLAAEPPTAARSAGAAAGIALALSAKPEVGAAALVGLLAAAARDRGTPRARAAVRIAAAGAGAAAALWIAAVAGLPRSALFPEGPGALFAPPAEWRAVYRAISGLADPAGGLSAVATALFLDAALLAAILLAARAAVAAPRAAAAGWAALVAAATAGLARPWAGVEDRLPTLLAPMPLAAAAGALWLLREPFDEARRARFLLYAFTAALASRVVLGVHYGAVTTPYAILAVPGLAATAAVLALETLPARTRFPAAFRRAAAVVFLAVAALAVVRWRRLLPPSSAAPVRTRAGSLLLPRERAAALDGALSYLAAAARPGDSLSGFPEAGFVNFVTGLRNPLREEQILPGHLDAASERRVVDRIESDRTGPRFVVLVNQGAPAFGAVAFGRDYAVEIWRAVERRYRLAATFGPGPPDASVGDPRFFIRVYERAPPAAASGAEREPGT